MRGHHVSVEWKAKGQANQSVNPFVRSVALFAREKKEEREREGKEEKNKQSLKRCRSELRLFRLPTCRLLPRTAGIYRLAVKPCETAARISVRFAFRIVHR